jgi:hypothetical protein
MRETRRSPILLGAGPALTQFAAAPLKLRLGGDFDILWRTTGAQDHRVQVRRRAYVIQPTPREKTLAQRIICHCTCCAANLHRSRPTGKLRPSRSDGVCFASVDLHRLGCELDGFALRVDG